MFPSSFPHHVLVPSFPLFPIRVPSYSTLVSIACLHVAEIYIPVSFCTNNILSPHLFHVPIHFPLSPQIFPPFSMPPFHGFSPDEPPGSPTCHCTWCSAWSWTVRRSWGPRSWRFSISASQLLSQRAIAGRGFKAQSSRREHQFYSTNCLRNTTCTLW